MSQQSRNDGFDEDPPSAQDIALGILLGTENLPQLMELHYYANEPGLLEIARALAALPDGAREQLREFLAASQHGIEIRREGSRLVIEAVPR
jgi:hypothetical protein